MPGHFLFIMIIAVSSLAFVIRLASSFTPIMVAGGITVILIIVLYFVSFIKEGSKLLELSYALLSSRKTSCDTKYMKAFLTSCYPFKAKIGPFMTLEKSTMVAILATIVDYTVTVLLL